MLSPGARWWSATTSMENIERKRLSDIKGVLEIEVEVIEASCEKWTSGRGWTLTAKVCDPSDHTMVAMMYCYGEKARTLAPQFQPKCKFRVKNVAVIPPREVGADVVLLNQKWALSVPNNADVVPIF